MKMNYLFIAVAAIFALKTTNAISLPAVDAILFTPPKNWAAADPLNLSSRVKVMVIGKGCHAFPPSINLGMEIFHGTLKDYLKVIQKINDTQGYQWKDLGTIQTLAGKASLSQVETKSKWGGIKMMHVILKQNNTIYILTAAALKEEFSSHYPTFFDSFRSLRFEKTDESNCLK